MVSIHFPRTERKEDQTQLNTLIRRELARVCDVPYTLTINKTTNSLIVRMTDKRYTLFLLTWNPKDSPYYRHTVIEHS